MCLAHLLALVVIVSLMVRGANWLQLLLISVLSEFCINNVTVCYSQFHYASLKRTVRYFELKLGKDDGYLLTRLPVTVLN